MTKRNKTIYLSIIVLSAVLFTGCGQGTTVTQIPNTSSLNNPSNTGDSGSNGSIPVSTDASVTAGILPPISYSFKLTGPTSNYTSPEFKTDNMLGVTVTSGSPSRVGTTGFTAYYSCLQFNVSVGSNYQQVKLSYGNPSGGLCAGVPSSQRIDFGNQLTTGHGAMTVVISEPQYDNCRTTPAGWGITGSGPAIYFYPTWGASGSGINYGGCTMTAVYSSHAVSATIKIHTNTTTQ